MIIASTIKRNGYYHAVLTVKDGAYMKTYTSKDIFLTKKVASKHADLWKWESEQIGRIVDF